MSQAISPSDFDRCHHTRRGVEDDAGFALRGSAILAMLTAAGLVVAAVAFLFVGR